MCAVNLLLQFMLRRAAGLIYDTRHWETVENHESPCVLSVSRLRHQVSNLDCECFYRLTRHTFQTTSGTLAYRSTPGHFAPSSLLSTLTSHVIPQAPSHHDLSSVLILNSSVHFSLQLVVLEHTGSHFVFFGQHYVT